MGHYSDTIDLDPGPGVVNFGSNGQSDIFIQKLDTTGQLVWGYSFGSYSSEVINSVVTDSKGSIYAAGSFYGSIDFDPGPGVTSLTSPGTGPLSFILKFTQGGQLAWVKTLGDSTSGESNFHLAVDGQDNLYLAFALYGDISLGTGSNTITLNSRGLHDIFILKFDSTGLPLYARQLGSESINEPKDFAVDYYGNITLLGTFADTLEYNQVRLNIFSKTGYGDYFIARIDRLGNLKWIKPFNSTFLIPNSTFTNSLRPFGLAVNTLNEVYLGGAFYDSADFDLGSNSKIDHSAGLRDGFLLKLDSNGNYAAHYTFGGSNAYTELRAVHCDLNNHIYTLGEFKGSVDFDPGLNTAILNSIKPGADDIFQCKLDNAGQLVWTNQLGNGAGTYSTGIMIDPAFNVYTIGVFSGTIDLNPGSSSQLFSSVGGNDAFIQKLNQNSFLSQKIIKPHSFGLYPNPTNRLLKIYLESAEVSVIRIYNSGGDLVLKSAAVNEYIDVSFLPPGVYYVQADQDGQSYTQAFIKSTD